MDGSSFHPLIALALKAHSFFKMQEALMRFLSTIQTDEIRLEFDDKHFFAEPVQGTSVLDVLAEQAAVAISPPPIRCKS